jgi:hypothetical protein
LNDEIIHVEVGPKILITFLDRIEQFSQQILECIDIGRVYKLGKPDYLQFLHQQKKTFEVIHARDKLIAIKYLIDLNLLYVRTKDFPIEYCLKFVEDCYNKSESLADRTNRIEEFCRNKFENLLDFLKKNSNNDLIKNNKLQKLLEIIILCHETGSKGILETLLM